MGFLRWLAIGLVLVGCSAGPRDNYLAAHMPPANWFPPAEYDHRYNGLVVIHSVPYEDIMSQCQLDSYQRVMGCSWTEEDAVFGTICMVVRINHRVEDITPEAVLRHEIGHCNGWPSDHPA